MQAGHKLFLCHPVCLCEKSSLPHVGPFGSLSWSFASLLFCCSVVKSYPSLPLPGLQHARPPCPSPSPGVCSNPRPLNQWCHPAISSSVIPFKTRRVCRRKLQWLYVLMFLYIHTYQGMLGNRAWCYCQGPTLTDKEIELADLTVISSTNSVSYYQ